MASLSLATIGLLDRGKTPAVEIAVLGYLRNAATEYRRDGTDGGRVREFRIISGKSELQKAIERLWEKYPAKRVAKKGERKKAKASAAQVVAEVVEVLNPLLAPADRLRFGVEIGAIALEFDPVSMEAAAAYQALVSQYIATADRLRQEEEIAVALLLAA